MAPAYNAPARTDVRGSWDLYLTGGYICWQPVEENLELGTVSSLSNLLNGSVAKMNFKYKSGFKVGLGFFPCWDNWDLYSQYTWLRGRHSIHATAHTGQTIIPYWGAPGVLTQISSGKSRWRLELDIIDLNLGRSCYVGTNLTLRPFFGARAAWIHQKYVATYNPIIGTLQQTPYQNRNTSTSWGVGGETGVLANYLMGCGFRFIGSVEADILLSSYNLRTKQDSPVAPSTLLIDLREHHLFYLRPHFDLELGFGWGSAFCNHNYHVDLLATYGFQVFWNQNMFRSYGGYLGTRNPVPNGDLFVQGLTVESRFDF
jgi:hypothetical protein